MNSKTNPAINVISIKIKIVGQTPRFETSKKLRTTLNPPSATNILANIIPPRRIVTIIEVMRKVFINASFKKLNLNVPYKTVRNIVPRAPIAPASVGVAQPNIIDPRTEKISVSNGTNAVIIIQTS